MSVALSNVIASIRREQIYEEAKL